MAVAHKGSISMGMVLIPVGLYKTTVDNDIHFNQLDKESKARIKYKKYCSHCGKKVNPEDIIKGYEYEKDKYVVMTEDELERIKTKKDKTIHILQFAKMSEVDTIYYEKDYYAIPDTGAEKAYELLRQALLAEKKVAIAKTVMGIGIVGHSQGGVGVVNAITDTAHKNTYKAAVSLSPPNKELAHNLLWDYDASLIDIPIMLISGEGGGDDWVVTGEQLQAIYDDISSSKLMARRLNTAHHEVLFTANGYMIAWFMWHLQGDEEAAGAFIGDHAEIMNNSLCQDQKQDLQ